MRFSRSIATAAALFAGLFPLGAFAVDPNLPAFHGDPSQTSVSGLSSGAFLAVQYQVAFSSTVKGVGVVAGGPYYCAAGQMTLTSICMGQVPFMPPDPALMVTAAQEYANQNKIDPLINLKNDRIYVFSGTEDSVVKQQAVDATVEFFKQAGVVDSNLMYVNNVPAGHALITPEFGNVCATNAAPYISHCLVKGQGYDQAGALLNHIYGKLNPPAKTLTGKIIPFNQREFSPASTGMAEKAFVYIPASCSNGAACKVHVALHGCLQSASKVNSDFYADTGYNQWADTNMMMVLYPQVDASYKPFNPNGCWDWWGYTGPGYATKSGVQLVAIKAMVDRLTSKN